MKTNKLTIVKKGHDRQGILSRDLSTQTEDPLAMKAYTGQMTRLCREGGGIGLAANQAGLPLNFFLIMPVARLSPSSRVAELVINPTWRPAPDSQPYFPVGGEGCLSLKKGQHYRVERQAKILAAWQNVQGHQILRTLTGLAAQVFQHECDHLRGLTLEETGEAI